MSLDNSSKALKAGAWYTASNVLIRSVSVITAPIFTRLLTPADYGLFNNFFSWQNILACVFGLCLNYSIGRAKIDFKDDFNGFISSIQTLSAITGFLLLVLALPFIGLLSAFMEIDKGLLISLLVMLIFSPSISYLQSKYRFEYRYKENVLIAIINTVGTVVISIILILLSDAENRYIGRILGSVIPIFILGIFAFIFLYIKGRTGINTQYWRYALRISLPMIPHGLAMVLLAQIDRIMLLKMADETAAGLYSFGYSYALIISVFTNAIMNAWQPWLYDNVSVGNYDAIKRSNKMLNTLGFVLMTAFIIMGPEVIMLLGTPAFYEAKWMVAPVVTVCYFQFIYSYFSLMEIYCKRTELIAIGSIGAALLKIVLNLYAIPRYGYVGAAYTTMVSYAVLMLYHWVIFRRIFKHPIYQQHQLAMFCVVAVIFTLLIVMVYENFLIRYVVLVLIIGLSSIIYRNKLQSLLKQYVFKNRTNGSI